jgi:hypothetical protein
MRTREEIERAIDVCLLNVRVSEPGSIANTGAIFSCSALEWAIGLDTEPARNFSRLMENTQAIILAWMASKASN